MPQGLIQKHLWSYTAVEKERYFGNFYRTNQMVSTAGAKIQAFDSFGPVSSSGLNSTDTFNLSVD
jgi:hypothetical protein